MALLRDARYKRDACADVALWQREEDELVARSDLHVSAIRLLVGVIKLVQPPRAEQRLDTRLKARLVRLPLALGLLLAGRCLFAARLSLR